MRNIVENGKISVVMPYLQVAAS